MVFVKHNRDLSVSLAQHHRDVQPNERTQPFYRVGNGLGRLEHSLFRDVHGVVHQVKENFFLTLKMMIQAAFAQSQRGGDIVHGGGVISLLLKQASRGAEDLLSWVERR